MTWKSIDKQMNEWLLKSAFLQLKTNGVTTKTLCFPYARSFRWLSNWFKTSIGSIILYNSHFGKMRYVQEWTNLFTYKSTGFTQVYLRLRYKGLINTLLFKERKVVTFWHGEKNGIIWKTVGDWKGDDSRFKVNLQVSIASEIFYNDSTRLVGL